MRERMTRILKNELSRCGSRLPSFFLQVYQSLVFHVTFVIRRGSALIRSSDGTRSYSRWYLLRHLKPHQK